MSKRKSAKQIERVVAYARVSTVEQAEKDLSIPAQLDAIRRYARERGYEVVQEYQEPGASGRDDNRPVFQRMLKDLMAPSANADAVLVFQSSRFMRNATKARLWKDTLKRRGIRVMSITQEISDDPSGSLIEGIFELFDEHESQVNGSRTSAGMRENAKRGYFNGAHAPFGFMAQRIEIAPGRFKRKLVQNADEVPTLREVFRLYAYSRGAKGVANELNARGLRRRGSHWTKDHVLRAISDSAAIGEYWWGTSDTKTGALRPREDWVLLPVQPVIDRELWDVVQRIRGERDPEKVQGRTSSSPLLLAGLAKCGGCGASYTLETSGKCDANGDRPHRYYNCRTFIRSGKSACPGHRIPVEQLETAVLEHLAEKVFSVERCREILRDVLEETGALREKSAEHRKDLKDQVTEIERRLLRWQEAFEQGSALDVVLPRLRELTAKRDELQQTLAKVVPLRPPPAHLYSEGSIAKFQATVRDIFLSPDSALAKNYVRFLVEQVVVNGSSIEIVGKMRETAALLASSASADSAGTTVSSHPSEVVLTSVERWLQLLDSNQGPGG